MHITAVVGTRPNYIKLAILLSKLQKNHTIDVINTGQHYDYDMSDIFFQELTMPNPDYNLGIHGGTNDEMVERCTDGIGRILSATSPECIIVFGDTNSSVSGACAGKGASIPVFHVEAGVRSFDRRMQEERNRITIDKISTLKFAPSETAVNNLVSEKIGRGVWWTGDIMIDTLNEFKRCAKSYKVQYMHYNLVTLHRAENVDNKEVLMKIFKGMEDSGEHFILPLHPRTKKNLYEFGIDELPDNITTIQPLGYLEMINMMYKSNKIITDSGGVQKEAYTLAKPCITLRQSTEWVETLNGGWNLLIDPEYATPNEINDAINNHKPWDEDRPWYYGNGHASDYISRIITEWGE